MGEPLRRRVRVRLLRGATHVSAILPATLLRSSLHAAGRLALRGRYGELTRRNLARVWKDTKTPGELESVARGVFRHSARLLAEWLRLARGAPPEGPRARRGAWIEELVTIDDSIERLERELARGRGAIVVTAHIGNWELAAAALRRRGMEGAVVGLERSRDSSARWLVEMRRGYGADTLAQDAPPRELLEVLARGRLLGLLADLEVRRVDGAFLPFLGIPALTMTAPAALARAHRAPLVPVRCVASSGPDSGYVLSVEEPLELDRSLARREATLDLAARMNRTFERWILETPEQWAWHQDRWRTRPGEYDAIPLAERKRAKAAQRARRKEASR